MGDGPPGAPIRLEERVLLALVVVAFVALGIDPPSGRGTWALENFPVAIAIPLLVATRRRFPLTPLAERLVFVHCIVLIVGGYWTYERVPVGNWVRDALGLERNPYDRFGHFLQGFVPAVLAREVLLRTSPLRRGGWLAFLVLSVCLAISAAYELVEWAAAVLLADGAADFLGSQGDVWDAQWDMFLAGCGAALALLLLPRMHDRELAALGASPPAEH
jgi:putative membrane protein